LASDETAVYIGHFIYITHLTLSSRNNERERENGIKWRSRRILYDE